MIQQSIYQFAGHPECPTCGHTLAHGPIHPDFEPDEDGPVRQGDCPVHGAFLYQVADDFEED
jgi:hypothetical protein